MPKSLEPLFQIAGEKITPLEDDYIPLELFSGDDIQRINHEGYSDAFGEKGKDWDIVASDGRPKEIPAGFYDEEVIQKPGTRSIERRFKVAAALGMSVAMIVVSKAAWDRLASKDVD